MMKLVRDDSISCEEFRKDLEEEIEAAKARIESYDERAALQSIDDGKTTTERALEALERAERFLGEHHVALAWLQSQGAHGARFRRFVK